MVAGRLLAIALVCGLSACAGAPVAEQAPVDTMQITGPSELEVLPPDLASAMAALQQAAQADKLLPLDTWCSARTLRALAKSNKLDVSPVPAAQLAALLARTPDRIVANGRLVVLDHATATPPAGLYWTREAGGWRLDPLTLQAYTEPDRGVTHPYNQPMTLHQATVGILGSGPLKVNIKTTEGTLHCTLYKREAPRTVAQFVGLARGLRAFRDGARHDDPKAGTWHRRRFYDGLTFHRVIPEFMIQGGDPEGSGEGGPGFAFEDELDAKLRFDSGGLLGMANSGPNTNGSQFFVTEGATPWLNDRHTIFGRCRDLDVVRKIARVPKREGDPSAPVEPIRILRMKFSRQK